MDFALSAEERDAYERTLVLARGELNPRIARAEGSAFQRETWEAAAHHGLAGLCIPSTWGGKGYTVMQTVQAVEALGYGCNDQGFVFALAAHLLACAVPIWRCGTDEQRRAFLPPLVSGRWVGGQALSEPEAGSDVMSLATTAHARGDAYVLNGRKAYVTNGPVADAFVVYATVDRTLGFAGVTAFLVHTQTPGLRVGPDRRKIGLRSSPLGELSLEECQVPATQRLGQEGAGAAIFTETMRWERCCLFALYVGAMQRALEECVAHATKRRQFGQTIGKFQSVANRVVDMRVRLDASRLLLYRAAWLLQQGKPCDLEIAMSKLFVSESAVLTGLDAIQIHGAKGCLEESAISDALTDAIPSRIFSGTSEMQRLVIARCLGL